MPGQENICWEDIGANSIAGNFSFVKVYLCNYLVAEFEMCNILISLTCECGGYTLNSNKSFFSKKWSCISNHGLALVPLILDTGQIDEATHQKFKLRGMMIQNTF